MDDLEKNTITEYLLVFERNGELGVVRVSGTYAQVSAVVGKEMELDGSQRCFICKVIQIVELTEPQSNGENESAST